MTGLKSCQFWNVNTSHVGACSKAWKQWKFDEEYLPNGYLIEQAQAELDMARINLMDSISQYLMISGLRCFSLGIKYH